MSTMHTFVQACAGKDSASDWELKRALFIIAALRVFYPKQVEMAESLADSLKPSIDAPSQ